MTEYISAGESWKNTGETVIDLEVTIPTGATALWTGSTWILTDAPTIVSGTPPANPAEGQQWVDSSKTPNILKVYRKYPTEGWVELSTTVKKGTDIGVDDGATKNNFSGAWVSGAGYQKGDIVTNTNGDSWSCNITHLADATNAPPADGAVTVSNSYWKLLAARGAKGASGQGKILGISFKRSATVLSDRPTGGSFTDAKATGWSDGVPDGTDQLYMSSCLFTSDGLGQGTWSIPAAISKNGATGPGSNLRYIFSSATGATPPTLPVNNITADTTDWSLTGASTARWMSVQANILSGTDSSILTYGNWSAAALIKGEDGKAGQGQVKAISFCRHTVAPNPPLADDGSFTSPNAIGTITAGSPAVDVTGTVWSDGIPSGTAQLYMTTRLFTSDAATPQQAAWTTPVAIAKDGSVGKGSKLQFSADNTNWHDTPASGDLYMRSGTSSDGTTYTYTGSVLIKGERGVSTKLQFSADNTNWHDTPGNGDLYMRVGTTTDGTNYTYAGSVTVKGEKGATGTGVKGDPGNSAVRVYRGTATNTQPGQPTGNYSTITSSGTAVDTWYQSPVTVDGTTIKMQWQCDGINTAAGDTTWGTPYLSYLKVDTLQAISTYTGNLLSVSGTGERLSINESDSHEFRAYSTNGLVASMGDSANDAEGAEYSFYSNVMNMTAAKSTMGGFLTRLPRWDSAEYAPGYGTIGLMARSNGTAGSMLSLMNVELGSMFRNANNLTTGLMDTATAGLFSSRQTQTGNQKLVAICHDKSSVDATDPIESSAGYFRYLSRTVTLCDANYAVNVYGWTHLTSGSTTVDLATGVYGAVIAGRVNISYSTQSVALCNGTDAISCTGNITTTGNVTAYDGSDERLKHDIIPIADPIAKLNKISGYTFTWNDDYYNKQNKDLFKQHDVGVIAQEIQSVIPQAVHEKDDGFLGVDYKKIIPLLIEVNKAQQLKIDELTLRLEVIENDIRRGA